MGEFLWLPGFRTKAILRVRVARVSAHAQRLSGGHASVQPCKRVLARVWFYQCLRVLTRVCVRARTRVRASGLKLMGGWFKAYGRVLFWHWTSARVRIYKHAEIWIYHLEAMSYMSGQWQPLNDESYWNIELGRYVLYDFLIVSPSHDVVEARKLVVVLENSNWHAKLSHSKIR